MDECKHKYYGRDGRGNVTYGPICRSQPVVEDCPGEEHCVGFQSDRADRAEAELAARGEERVVEVAQAPESRKGWLILVYPAGSPCTVTAPPMMPGHARAIFGSEEPAIYAIRRISDAKPVAEAELAAGEERVVEVEVSDAYHGIEVRWPKRGAGFHSSYGSERAGRYEVRITRLPADPKPDPVHEATKGAVGAELAAERVVVLGPRDRLYHETADGEHTYIYATGPEKVAIRRLPDPKPDPVAVRPWLIRPNAAQPYLVCGYCQWRAEVGAVACGECGKPFLEPEELPSPVAGGAE